MAKYLFAVSYSVEGSGGILKEGGTMGRDMAEGLAQSVGGTVESFYYAFGDVDAYLIADLPDNESAVAASLIAGASGGVVLQTTPLITVEQMDAASKKASG